jgi:hypothetical protein
MAQYRIRKLFTKKWYAFNAKNYKRIISPAADINHFSCFSLEIYIHRIASGIFGRLCQVFGVYAQ